MGAVEKKLQQSKDKAEKESLKQEEKASAQIDHMWDKVQDC